MDESTARCSRCRETKPLDLFGPNPRKSNGRNSSCRACDAARVKAYYAAHLKTVRERRRLLDRTHPERKRDRYRRWEEKHPEARIAHTRRRNRAMEARIRAQQRALKEGRCCAACGRESDPARLEWHHRNPAEKAFNIADAFRKYRNPGVIERELAKCDLLCKPCHRQAHRDLRRAGEF